MSSDKAKRKREDEQLPLQEVQEVQEHNDEQLKRRAMSSPRVQIVPGLWRRIVRRRRSKKDAKPWTCSCGFVNKPIQHLFFDLPRFKCKSCQKPIPETYEFEFSLAEIKGNGICPLGNVKNQGNRPHCMIYSSATTAELTKQITSIFMEEDVDDNPLICMRTFMNKLKSKKQVARSVDFEHYDGRLNIEDLWTILGILQEGVNLDDTSEVLKISGFSEVPLDFPLICKYLAEGNPLLAAIRTGKGFDDLKWNEIYKPPKKSAIVQGKSSGLHCITVVGGGMRKNRKMYYKYVNTHGTEFCPLRNLKRKDGIQVGFGNVVSEGLLMVVKFNRYWQGVPGESNLSCPKPHGQSIGGQIHRPATLNRQYIMDEWSVQTKAAAALGKLSALSTRVDLLYMLQSGNEAVNGSVLSALNCAIKHAGKSVSSAIRSRVCALREDLLQAQADDVHSCAAKVIATLSQYMEETEISNLVQILLNVSTSSDWCTRHGALLSFSSTSMRSPSKLCHLASFPSLVDLLKDSLKDDKFPVREVATRTLGRILCFKLQSEAGTVQLVQLLLLALRDDSSEVRRTLSCIKAAAKKNHSALGTHHSILGLAIADALKDSSMPIRLAAERCALHVFQLTKGPENVAAVRKYLCMTGLEVKKIAKINEECDGSENSDDDKRT